MISPADMVLLASLPPTPPPCDEHDNIHDGKHREAQNPWEQVAGHPKLLTTINSSTIATATSCLLATSYVLTQPTTPAGRGSTGIVTTWQMTIGAGARTVLLGVIMRSVSGSNGRGSAGPGPG